MKYLKKFNENNYLKYNPTLTEDDTDVASTSIWRKILSVLSKTPIGNLNLVTKRDFLRKNHLIHLLLKTQNILYTSY